MPTYCGTKRPVPRGKTLGTPAECLKKGFGAGFASASEKGKKATRKAFARGASVSAQASRRKTFRNINKVTMDELREIAVKLKVATRGQMKAKGGTTNLRQRVREALIKKGVPPQGNLDFPFSRQRD